MADRQTNCSDKMLKVDCFCKDFSTCVSQAFFLYDPLDLFDETTNNVPIFNLCGALRDNKDKNMYYDIKSEKKLFVRFWPYLKKIK